MRSNQQPRKPSAKRQRNSVSTRWSTASQTSWMDVGPHDVTKASMLQEVCSRKGMRADRVIAIGDNWNDVPMLEWAGLVVAMGSAVPQIQAKANLITLAEPGDGAAAVLEAVASR